MPAPRQLDAQALLLRNLASALDAGLPVDEILAGPASHGLAGQSPPGTSISQALRQRDFPLRPHEVRQLEAAEQAGRIDLCLRQLAEDREKLAELRQGLRRALARPLLNLTVACLVMLFLAVLGMLHSGPAALLGGSLLLTAVLALRVWRSIDGPGRPGGGVPGAERILRDWGEIPYLRAMHGLYAAGLGIHEAHRIAQAGVPLRSLREALQRSGEHLNREHNYAESLEAAQALDPETRSLLRSAELAGDLEDCFARALRRRSESLELHSGRSLRWLSAAVTLLTYGIAAWVILGFYGNLFGARLGLG